MQKNIKIEKSIEKEYMLYIVQVQLSNQIMNQRFKRKNLTGV